MGKISRKTFIKQTSLAGALAMTPMGIGIINGQSHSSLKDNIDDKLMKRLAEGNDKQVDSILKSYSDAQQNSYGHRNYTANFAVLSAAYCCRLSKYYQNATLIQPMEAILDDLLKAQNPDGTMDAGNLQSPPDTAFMMENLIKGTHILHQNKSKELNNVKEKAKLFITKAANTIAEGGIHTPNHRWAVCSVLANVNSLYPDQKYVDRVNDWLGEHVFIDNDGEYAERSKNYARVNNSALIEIGRLLDKPELFELVRKNLNLTYYQMEPNGELITNNSRRQDQFSIQSIIGSYLFYRYLAIRDNNGEFADISKTIEALDGFDEAILDRSLPIFMDEPLLQKPLPSPVLLPVNYEKVFPDSSLLRIRRENTTTTLFGGNDWPLIIASGRSHIPNFFAFRKGEAILRYMRFSTRFFSMGYFRSQGLRKEGDKYVLFQKLEAPYYHPLPAEYRNPKGDYKHSPSIDDRFWSKMDFEHRPTTMKVLETTISLDENDGRNELTFLSTGSDKVPVTIELCFTGDGKLTGVKEAPNGTDNYFLEEGYGKYQVGTDVIEFGPGTVAHWNIQGLEGEKYSTHSGNLRTPGLHVYLTGITPFEHKLLFF
jgi:hypothetical protein